MSSMMFVLEFPVDNKSSFFHVMSSSDTDISSGKTRYSITLNPTSGAWIDLKFLNTGIYLYVFIWIYRVCNIRKQFRFLWFGDEHALYLWWYTNIGTNLKPL